MLRTERNHDCVISRCCLELEIKRTAKAFSKCQTPGAIDSAAERRMQNQLHAARFIEEAFQHQRLL